MKQNIMAGVLIVVCLLAALVTIHPAFASTVNIAQVKPQITVNIKPSDHKLAYFSPTYVYCTVQPGQLCNIKFINKTKATITLHNFATLLGTLKPGQSIQHGFAYSEWSNGPDEHPTWEVVMQSASCYIFITQG